MKRNLIILFSILFSMFATASATEEQTACDDILKPVCASLEVQCVKAPCYPVLQTFDNECEMSKNPYATFLHEGSCEEANSIGGDVEEPLICNDVYAPVCGADGKTYGNDCYVLNVGLKYRGRCLGPSLEKKLQDAWEPVYKSYSEGKSDLYNAMLLEQIVNKAIILTSEATSPVRESSFSYLGFLAGYTLTNEIFYNYISEHLAEVVHEEPVLGGTWYITDIEWLTHNIAIINYEDGHIADSTKIYISAKSDGFVLTKLEDKLTLSFKFMNTAFGMTLKTPKSWDSLYGYKISDSNKSIDFYYKAKRESNETLFGVYFFTNEEWEKISSKEINTFRHISELGDFVVAYGLGLTPEYRTDENISNYSIMSKEILDVVDTIEVYFK